VKSHSCFFLHFDLHFLYGQTFLFMYFLAIWISSFEKALFSSFAHFFAFSLILGGVQFLNSLYILFISPLSGKDFLPFCICSLFNLETISFAVQKLFKHLCFRFYGFIRQHSIGLTQTSFMSPHHLCFNCFKLSSTIYSKAILRII
jgi:hypothetical protein